MRQLSPRGPAAEPFITPLLLLAAAGLFLAVGLAAGTLFGWTWCSILPGTCTL
jgi:hypothetical protein